LHVVEGGLYGCLVGFVDLDRGVDAAEPPEQRDRLWRREGQIEAGDRAVSWDALAAEQRIAVDRVAASEHRLELFGADLALKAQLLGGAADPLAGNLALAGVVVLGACGDLVEVVGLLAFA
jgi:hypothetical protein